MGPTNLRQFPGVLVLPVIGVLVVALVRAPAPQRVPEQLLRLALLGGLAFWAVRGDRVVRAVPAGGLVRTRPTVLGAACRRRPGYARAQLAGGRGLSVALVAATPSVQRALFAPADRWDLYLAVATGRWDTERPLDRWGVDHVVTSRQATPVLVELLESSGRWRLAFSTGDQRVYLRAAGPAVSRPSLPPPAP